MSFTPGISSQNTSDLSRMQSHMHSLQKNSTSAPEKSSHKVLEIPSGKSRINRIIYNFTRLIHFLRYGSATPKTDSAPKALLSAPTKVHPETPLVPSERVGLTPLLEEHHIGFVTLPSPSKEDPNRLAFAGFMVGEKFMTLPEAREFVTKNDQHPLSKTIHRDQSGRHRGLHQVQNQDRRQQRIEVRIKTLYPKHPGFEVHGELNGYLLPNQHF